jgi:DNA-binding transcriptional MocR family regulator
MGWTMVANELVEDSSAPAAAKLVYMAIAYRGGSRQGVWSSHKDLAAMAGVSVATVKRALNWLRENGWISWEARQRPDGSRTTNMYRLGGLDFIDQGVATDLPPAPSDLGASSHRATYEQDSSEQDSELLTVPITELRVTDKDVNLTLRNARARYSTNRVDETSPAYAAHLWSMR